MPDRAPALIRPLRVLVVDDEFLIADHMADVLTGAGHEVVGTAASAEQALGMVDGGGIDLAVVDIKLAGAMDGIALGHRLGQRGIGHVYVSGSGDAETVLRARATGPLAFLQKPFDEARLLAALRNWARSAAASEGEAQAGPGCPEP